MARVVGNRLGRLSHGIRLTSPIPIPLDDALQATKDAVRGDRLVRNLAVEADTIWTAAVTLQYDAEPEPGMYTIWVAVGRRPIGEGDGFGSSIDYIKNRVQNRLELMEIRQSGIVVQGVREIRVWLNAGSVLLANERRR
jgi:hypothetical protein